MEITRESYKVRSFDASAYGTLTASRLLGYLLEAAGNSARSLGISVADLQQRGLTWVIGRIRIQLEDEISVGQDIEVETWPSGLDRSVAMRDFRILRDGQIIGRSTSRWFVLDMETRLAVRPQGIFPEALQPQLEHELKLSRILPSLPGSPTLRRSFEVRRADIDFNRHVTAASYLDWATEAVPVDKLDGHKLTMCDVQFLEECHLGDSIVSESCVDADDTVLLRISRERDGQELARLATTWVPKQTAGASRGSY